MQLYPENLTERYLTADFIKIPKFILHYLRPEDVNWIKEAKSADLPTLVNIILLLTY